MTAYGEFETVDDRPFQRGAASEVWAARRRGEEGEARFAVKVVDPILHTDAQAEEFRRRLTEAATLQQQLGEGGAAASWAPVHEVGIRGTAAFYVADRFELSAARLRVEKRAPSTAELLHIVRGVVRGLRELQTAFGRAHGNLKLENVFVTGGSSAGSARGRLQHERILLADPLSGSELKRDAERDDVRDIGRLIYALVLHTERRGDQYGVAVPASADWKALGPSGERWRALCQRLLSYDPPGLDELEEALNEIEAAASARRPVPVAAVAGVAVVVVLAVLALVLWPRTTAPPAPVNLDIALANWAWPLHDAVDREDLERVFGIPAGSLERVHRDLEPDERDDAERAAEKLKNHATEWLENVVEPEMAALSSAGFEPVAEALRQEGRRVQELLAAPVEDPDARRGQEDDFVDRVRRAESARQQASKIRTEWAALTQQTDQLRQTQVPLISGFHELVKQYAHEATSPGYLTDVIAEQSSRAERLIRLHADHWPGIDQECFWRRSGIDQADLSPENLDRWEREVPRPQYTRLREEDDPRMQFDSLQVALAERIDDHVVKCIDRSLDGDPRSDLAARYAVFSELKWDRCHDETIRQEWDHLVVFVEREDRRIAGEIRKCEEDCDQTLHRMVSGVEQNPFASPLLQARWDTGLEMEYESCPQRRDVLMGLKDALDELQGRMGFDPLHRSSAQQVAVRRLNDALQTAMRETDWQIERPLPPSRWDHDFRTWLDEARGYLAAIETTEARLDDVQPFEELGWPAHVVNDLVELDEVRAVRERYEAMRSLHRPGIGIDELVSTADTNESAELRFEAWRLLGHDARVRAHDLAHEKELQESLLTALDRGALRAGGPRLAELRHELEEGGAQRWLAHARAAADRDSLRRIAEFEETFRIDRVALEDRLRFNLELLAWAENIEALAAGEDEEAERRELMALLERFQTWAAGWNGHLGDEFEQELAQIQSDAQSPDQPSFGPVAAGWEEVEDNDERLRTFRAPADGPLAGQVLRFGLVEPAEGEGEPAYLLLHEVPVSLFIAALNAEGRVKPGVRQLFDKFDRRGADVRTWEVRGQVAVSAQDWTGFDRVRNVYQRVPPSPSAHHPAQWVSPAAAVYVAGLLGCRLPTGDEWRTAMREANDAQSPNLRCEWWLEQFEHEGGGLSRIQPDEGIFRPSGGSVWAQGPDGRPAREGERPWADGDLWFRAVNDTAAGMPAFRDLVGNVWEIVVNEAESFDELLGEIERDPGRLAASRVAEWIASQRRTGFSVIGGSALSHPDLDLHVPHPFSDGAEWWKGTFSDVGFRLAFSATEPFSAREDLLALVGSQFRWR